MPFDGPKVYASDYPRDEKGWIRFPRDVEHRKELFPQEVFDHPAKAQLFMTEELISFYTQPGDNILDPFGGTGTTAVGCTMNRNVTLCELEPVFLPILRGIYPVWEGLHQLGRIGPLGKYTLLEGDCRVTLKSLPENSFDAVITSPPYANLQVGKNTEREQEFDGALAREKARARAYGSDKASVNNFGRMNNFIFNKQMKVVYDQVYRLLKPNGVYISVTKDQMKGQGRNLLAADILAEATKSGLKYSGDWYKWKTPGSMLGTVMKEKGSEVVEDEDVVVFRKPQ